MLIKQIDFLTSQDLGYEKSGLVDISIFKDRSMNTRLESFKNELKKHPNILNATATNVAPGYDFNKKYYTVEPEGFPKDQKFHIASLSIDQDYVETMGLEIVKGRNVSLDYSTDLGNAILINEEAERQFGWDDPIGKHIKVNMFDSEGTIVGVVKDFHFESLRRSIEPLVFIFDTQVAPQILVRIQPTNIKETVEYMKKVWHDFSPNYTFWHSFVDQRLENLYKKEERTSNILTFSATFAIFIACLGLLGLSTFTVERRFKEIGIRKVLGSSVTNIIILLFKDFFKLIVAANIIAWPIVFYFMSKWLQNFAYKMPFNIWLPLLLFMFKQ